MGPSWALRGAGQHPAPTLGCQEHPSRSSQMSQTSPSISAGQGHPGCEPPVQRRTVLRALTTTPAPHWVSPQVARACAAPLFSRSLWLVGWELSLHLHVLRSLLILLGETAFLSFNTVVRLPRHLDTGHSQFRQEPGRLADERHARLPTAGHPDQGNSWGWGLGLQTTPLARSRGRRPEDPSGLRPEKRVPGVA